MLATLETGIEGGKWFRLIDKVWSPKNVALFGPTNPDVWRPLGEHVIVIRGEGARMDTVGVETVLDVVNACGSMRFKEGNQSQSHFEAWLGFPRSLAANVES